MVFLASSLLLLISGAVATYAPALVQCPTTALIRQSGLASTGNQTLNPDEIAYVKARQALLPAAFTTWLGPNASAIYAGDLSNEIPTVALSISGGGDRAALYGAGFLAAADYRNATAAATGFGGLLQVSTYIAALSGGSWMLSSFINPRPGGLGMPDAYEMVLGAPNSTNSTGGWNLALDLFTPSTNATVQKLWTDAIFVDLTAKVAAGFNVTFGDYWARALSYHFLPGTTTANFFDNSEHGNSVDFTNVVNNPDYVAHLMPFPFIVGNAYSVNEKLAPEVSGADVALQSVVYEMSPLEFGSYDQSLSSFIPMKYLGTGLNVGKPINSSACVNNFSNSGFILGISSNLFNLYNVSKTAVWANALSPVNVAWERINSTFYNVQPMQQLDISAVSNPFQGINGAGSQYPYEDSDQTQLRLIDGGLDGEVDAVEPLIVPARKVDCLVVVDSAADSALAQPNGASLRATALRATLPGFNLSVPPLPMINTTWISQGLATRPTFFGCNGTAATLNGTKTASPYPLFVYLPNYNPAGVTNTTTGQIAYNNTQAGTFLDATFKTISSGYSVNFNATAPLWSDCMKCATVERSRGRAGLDLTPTCQNCFARYCWNGKESTATNSTGGASGSGSGSGSGTSSASGSTGSTPATAKSGAQSRHVGIVGLVVVIVGVLVL